MRNPCITAFGVTLLLAMGALALPANSAIAAANGSSSPTAVAAKKCKKGFVKKNGKCVKAKKCKKGYARKVVKHKRVCVKKRRTNVAPTAPTTTGPPAQAPAAPAARAWSEGRWGGSYSDNSVELLFNVVGGQLYTGAFDSFYVDPVCEGGAIDPANVAPVQATISPNGDFSGSGVDSPGFGQQIPWQVSGHISGTSITNGTFTVGPYVGLDGGSCSGTTHFTGQWIAGYTL
jgi:hypothetical protein